ncbi:MAG: glycine zipper domain-containing protein [Pseudorhodobacter sp.]
MKKYLVILPLAVLALAGCQPSQNTTIGALGGAAVGAAVADDGDRAEGALIGAAVGAAAGSLIGPAQQQGQCYYRNSQGQRYIAPC